MVMNNYLAAWESHFTKNRPFLLSFSFRLTGSFSEAEDMVQEAFLACAGTDPATVSHHRSWLTKVCANKSLDLLKSAAKKRETYPGTWLPDAVPDVFQYWGNIEEGISPDKKLLNEETFTTGALIMIQKLTPEERVIWIMSDVLDYSFQEIGELLKKSEEACKKTAQRARLAFNNLRRNNLYSEESMNVIRKFYALASAGDAEGLEAMFAPDAEMWSDGGGKVSVSSMKILTDVKRMAKFIAGIWTAPFMNTPNVKQEYAAVNRMNGQVISRLTSEGVWVLETVSSIEVVDGKITRIYAQRNPDKLNALFIPHS
ncbi:MAG: sigma-70 family RNA polymerase sigma factor [Bdellovibrionota bacterium]